MSDPAIITGIFTLLGVAIGSFATFAIASRTARLENQRHLRELGLKLALTDFDATMKQAETEARITGRSISVPHLAVFVAEGMKVAEILSDQRLNAFEVGKQIANLKHFRTTIARGMDATP